jgi:protein-disulfide isomerase
MKKIQFISLIVLIIIWIGSTHYVISNQTDKIVAKMLAIEYYKVWWIENYVKITKITREQTIIGLKQYEAQNAGVQAPIQNNNAILSNSSKMTLEQAKKVVGENTYILWNPDAEISFVEYSDLECPYCKKLHKSWTIQKVLKEYDWKVNFIFKQFALNKHVQASMEAEAALCVWDLSGGEKYYKFIEKAFEGSKTNGRSYTKETIAELWSSIWVSKIELLSCINSWKFKVLADYQLNEWKSLFGITWTPWNVFINNKTGNWDKLPGANTFESFKQKIDTLLK